MTPGPAETVLVASDVHLGSIPGEQESAFLTWLEQAREAAGRIVLNGDLFDFWFEYFWGHTAGHGRALDLLRSIVDDGVPITLMGGNHDWWGGRFLREEIGLEFLQDPVVRDFAGFTTLLAHGDGLGNGDLGYRLMRVVLRGRLTRLAFGSLPPAVGDRVARGISQTEERWDGQDPHGPRRAAELRTWARDALEEDEELDLVLLGHTHLPELIEPTPGRWYVNSGDWVYHRTYVVLREGEPPRLEEWNGSIR